MRVVHKHKFRVQATPADLSAHRTAVAEWRQGRRCVPVPKTSKSFIQCLDEKLKVVPLLQTLLPTIQRETIARHWTCADLKPFDILCERKRVLVQEKLCVRQ